MISSVFTFSSPWQAKDLVMVLAMHAKFYLLTYCVHKASIRIPLKSSILPVSLLIKSQDILGVGLKEGDFALFFRLCSVNGWCCIFANFGCFRIEVCEWQRQNDHLRTMAMG